MRGRTRNKRNGNVGKAAPSHCRSLLFSAGGANSSRSIQMSFFLLANSLSAWALSLRTSSFRGLEGAEASSRYFTSKLVAPPLERALDLPTPPLHYLDSKPLDVIYTNDPHTVAQWLSKNIPSRGWTTIGFDTEAVPTGAPWISKRKVNFLGPATVQLSTVESTLVVQFAKPNGKPCRACTPLVEGVLRDASIVKAGCNLDDDLLELHRCLIPNLEAVNRLDLCGLGSLTQVPGLKRLTSSVLGLDLPKHKKLSASDWSQVPLTEKQIAYAARDAWAAAAIMECLSSLDHDRFGSRALASSLQASQSTLEDLSRRRKNRKQAKELLSTILPRKGDETETHDLPPWKAAVVRELKAVLHENRRESCVRYHVPALALSFNQTSF